MRAYFVSDLHLKSPDEPRTKAFVAWLRALPTESPSHVFLVGDIFDLWIGSHSYFVERFTEVVEAIRGLRAAGIEVHFFEGNHDLHLTRFWEDELGVKVHADARTFELAGTRVRVEHGDLINPNDRGYLFLRWFLRTPLMTTLALHLPSRVVKWIGEKASGVSRSYHPAPDPARAERIRRLVRTHAERVSQTESFDLVITGHVHVRDDHQFEASGRQVRSINLGSWDQEPYQALLLNEAAQAGFTPITPHPRSSP
jgi:UDP-2,3-diacylglucosamine hydrolase